ncbi:MAG: hypothetical protein K0R55_1457 [Sporomusa sp.]|jgi:multidrug transporter EmrE-like cation transporter|nr:hypothetical protein [Sporomusa sp.]
MSKIWMSVVIAAFFEVGWVIGLKHANSVLELRNINRYNYQLLHDDYGWA